MTLRLADKVAVVTGGASGIGAQTAVVLAREGAAVVVADINLEGALQQAEALRAQGARAVGVYVDLGDEHALRGMLSSAVSTFGGLDVLVNNAANTHLSSTSDGPIETMDFAVWDELMRVNLRGTAMAIQQAIPLLRSRGGGAIVNVSSGAARLGAESYTAYGVGKAAIIALTQYTATQHGKEGIRCNAIAPGLVVTPATGSDFAEGRWGQMMLRHHLTPRLGTPDDMANAILWLACEESGFVTGQCINVDGGLQAHQPYWADAVAARAGRTAP